MNKLLTILFAVVFLASCSSNKEMKVTIGNPSDYDRLSELVEIPIDSIKDKVALKDSLVYVVKNSEGEIIPSQVTYDRKVIFQPEMKAKETKTFTISTDMARVYPAKTYGRLISERYDDFAWENDRVAFRIYGAALLPVDGPSNGIDLWYKRTNDLVIDKWYQQDLAGKASYHNDNGEGLDDYKVGRTLGAGAMAPYVNNKLWLNENFVSDELLDNGPLRTTFKLTYKDIEVDGKAYGENRTFSIDAGSQLTKVAQAYAIKEPMTVAAGIVKRERGDSIISAIDKGYIIYAEPKTNKSEGVYVSLVFPEGISDSVTDTYEIVNAKSKKSDKYAHVLAVTTQQPKKPVVYYTGYGWAKFGFSTLADFEKYIQNFSESLRQPLTISYK
ncbi:MAG: DUF4861 domain-containing protein [Prevotella sp.]|jgi:hypothetical protein|nr:DUF4861 domain-containing protein [Prevotella sp.]